MATFGDKLHRSQLQVLDTHFLRSSGTLAAAQQQPYNSACMMTECTEITAYAYTGGSPMTSDSANIPLRKQCLVHFLSASLYVSKRGAY